MKNIRGLLAGHLLPAMHELELWLSAVWHSQFKGSSLLVLEYYADWNCGYPNLVTIRAHIRVSCSSVCSWRQGKVIYGHMTRWQEFCEVHKNSPFLTYPPESLFHQNIRVWLLATRRGSFSSNMVKTTCKFLLSWFFFNTTMFGDETSETTTTMFLSSQPIQRKCLGKYPPTNFNKFSSFCYKKTNRYSLVMFEQWISICFLVAEGWKFVEIYKWMFAKTLDWLHMFSMSRQHIMDIPDQHNVVCCVESGDSPVLQYTEYSTVQRSLLRPSSR